MAIECPSEYQGKVCTKPRGHGRWTETNPEPTRHQAADGTEWSSSQSDAMVAHQAMQQRRDNAQGVEVPRETPDVEDVPVTLGAVAGFRTTTVTSLEDPYSLGYFLAVGITRQQMVEVLYGWAQGVTDQPDSFRHLSGLANGFDDRPHAKGTVLLTLRDLVDFLSEEP